jgi:predicted transcriptional regulator
MRFSYKPFIIFILLFSFYSINAYALNDQPVNHTYNYSSEFYAISASYGQPSINPDNPYADPRWNGLISFWDLPSWLKTFYISTALVSALLLIKLLPLLFGRLKHVLDNPKTKEIFYFIQRNPGVTIAEISEEQNINRGTLKYHLSQLLANNKIILVRKGKFSRAFFNTTSAHDRDTLISQHLKNEKSKEILFAIMDSPGITHQEISSRFNLAKSSTSDYLKTLFDDNILEFHQDGKFKRYYIKQEARMILLRYKPQ